jgi:hypothetical protein
VERLGLVLLLRVRVGEERALTGVGENEEIVALELRRELVEAGEDDWLVVLADGSFDGSPAAWNRVLWRFSENLYDVAPVEIFFNEFYNPGLLSELFVRRQIPSLKSAQDIAQKDRRQPLVSLALATGQAAQEAAKFGHGFLTFALVEEGVKQARADYEPKDGEVVAREWFDCATERAPQMQIELMREAQAKRGVKVAFVKGEEQIDDPAKRNVQHPRVFYRREGEAAPVVIAKP